MENKCHIVPMEEAKFEDYEVQFDDVTVTYSQNDEDGDDCQEIVFKTKSIGAGRYYNISTQSWSFENLTEFATVLKDFIIRAGMDLNDLIVNLKNENN